MREYGQIQSSFWQSPDAQELSDQGKLLACYLLTGPHTNGLGCFRLPDGYIQADFGWSSETVTRTVRELFANGFLMRCETTNFVLIPKYLKWNPIPNPNGAKARIKEVEMVPKKASIYSALVDAMERFGNHWPNGYMNGLANGIANKTKTKTKTNTSKDMPTSDEAGEPDDGFDEFWSEWPRKVAKKDAQKAWRGLTKTKRREAHGDVQDRNRSGLWPATEFIPYPASYLRGERWDDEASSPSLPAELQGAML